MIPETSLGTNRTYEQVMGGFLPGLRDYYAHPYAYRLAPFRIFGNLYYVGDRKVCAHLVDTGDGLILFDTGYAHTLHLLIESIREMGFRPADLRWIIHSHGHFDHMGGGDELRAMYGAKVFMSAADTQLLRERPERALTALGPNPYAPVCWPDTELQDGDVLTLGNTSIRCVLTPGHTCGTMSFFFTAGDGDDARRVGYLGGVGFLTVYQAFCREYGLPEDLCVQMGASIQRVWDEQVDIVLGNHPNHNCTLEKRAYMLAHPGENPFVNPEAWHIFLTALETRRLDFLSKGY